MKAERFEWQGAFDTAALLRLSTTVAVAARTEDVRAIGEEVSKGGDEAVLRLTARFDAPDNPPSSLRVDPALAAAALENLDVTLRDALELAADNIEAVAEAQLDSKPRKIELPQGQTIATREIPVAAAGIYAPGGKASYPSSVLMCAIPARVAGVGRLALASPPGRDGRLSPLVLAAAALCRVDEIYAMGGAQAIFALAHGTKTVGAVSVIVGPGNTWVQEAKREVYGAVGIDSYAGPSELMLIAGPETDPAWAALDLCSQAEHGFDAPLVVVATESAVLDAIAAATVQLASERPSVDDSLLGLVQAPDPAAAIDLANEYAPEHLELLGAEAASLAERVTTAGCVFVGTHSATAFGDYVAGSNHVLPTAGAGRFAGPLSPRTFMRTIATVEVPAAAATKLAPHVDALARAEGFPVHAESAMIRGKEGA
ncbi:MAG TPA: histidinol dehydrogenase [Solirubrobacterales bacterium]|nr:histidinol dehydrogenase [Solirubrobacterales bacterium]